MRLLIAAMALLCAGCSSDDDPNQKLQPPHIGRFAIVQDLHTVKHTYLLDTVTGRTWVGTAGPKGQDIWVEVAVFDPDGKELRTLVPPPDKYYAPIPHTEQ